MCRGLMCGHNVTVGETSTSDAAAQLAELFEFELCDSCGGGVEDHEMVPGPFGLPFAACLRAEPSGYE